MKSSRHATACYFVLAFTLALTACAAPEPAPAPPAEPAAPSVEVEYTLGSEKLQHEARHVRGRSHGFSSRGGLDVVARVGNMPVIEALMPLTQPKWDHRMTVICESGFETSPSFWRVNCYEPGYGPLRSRHLAS